MQVILLPNMRIAINTKLLLHNYAGIYYKYMQLVITNLVNSCSNYQFLIITDNTEVIKINESSNCTKTVIPLNSKQTLAINFWYNLKLAVAVKKFKADIILHFDSRCIAGIKTPQIICFSHLLFISQKESLSRAFLLMYSINQKKWIKNAKAVIVFSQFTKKVLENKYKLNGNKFCKINFGITAQTLMLNHPDKETLQNKYADGSEYFLCIDYFNTEQDAIQLLKAFTIFKKRLQSGMKLIIAVETTINNAVKEKLKNYKFKADVVLIENVEEEELQKIQASAYAYFSPKMHSNFAFREIEVMQQKIPIACSNTGCLPEIFTGDSALFFDTNDEKTIAEQMMMLYKDENLRNNLIIKGSERMNEFCRQNEVNQIIQLLQNTTKEY